MRLRIKKVILDQFKGVSHAEYDLFDYTKIAGRNGSGKTTIADAVMWVFADKDYSLKSKPEVHPNFMEDSVPSVTLVCDIDGAETTLRKYQLDGRTQRDIEENKPISIDNRYEINSVPQKSRNEFDAYLEKAGIDVKNFLLLSHTEMFTGQKTTDCRKILFDMASGITDTEIATGLPNCEEVIELLQKHTLDEITKLKEKERKESEKNRDSVPEQIKGLEKGKVDIDVDEFKRQRETLESEIARLEEDIANNAIPSISELNQKLVLLEKEERQLTTEANQERVRKLTDLDKKIGELKVAYAANKHMIQSGKDSIAADWDEKGKLEKQYSELESRWNEAKKRKFSLDITTCPYCGQELPVHKLDEAKQHFENDKQESLNKINVAAKDVRNSISKIEVRVKEATEKVQRLNVEILEQETLLAELNKTREPLEKPIAIEGSEAQEKILSEIINVRHQISQRDELVEAEDQKRAEIAQRREAIRQLDMALGQAESNADIDNKIAELKDQQREYTQTAMNADKVLDQIKRINMKKNELLTDAVNSHFQIVKFKLFEQQVNGKFKDICTPVVDGKIFGESANTALMIRAQLDIIAGLQKFYDQHIPVFLDGAEALDDNNKSQIDIDTQMVMMCVSESDFDIIEH